MNRNPYGYQVSFGPPVTPAVKALIIANVAVFFLQLLTHDQILVIFGLVPAFVTSQYFVWQLATYLFLHGGVWHLLLNMFGLWMFGSELEGMWGPAFFLRYYFVTGIGAGLLSVLVHPHATEVTIGASGAVYGILLAYGMTFPNRMLLLYFVIPVKAKYFVAGLGALAFISALQTPGGPVAHLAHLGGMVFGLVYLKGWLSAGPWKRRYHQWRLARLRRKFHVYHRTTRPEKHDDYSVH